MSNDDYQHINFFEMNQDRLKSAFKSKPYTVLVDGTGKGKDSLVVTRKADRKVMLGVYPRSMYELSFSSINGSKVSFCIDENMYELLKQHFTNGK